MGFNGSATKIHPTRKVVVGRKDYNKGDKIWIFNVGSQKKYTIILIKYTIEKYYICVYEISLEIVFAVNNHK